MASLEAQIKEYFEGTIDFVGQNDVEKLAKIFLIAASVLSFIVGFALQSIQYTFWIFTAATAVVALITLPPWPQYNKNPVTWLPKLENEGKGSQKS